MDVGFGEFDCLLLIESVLYSGVVSATRSALLSCSALSDPILSVLDRSRRVLWICKYSMTSITIQVPTAIAAFDVQSPFRQRSQSADYT